MAERVAIITGAMSGIGGRLSAARRPRHARVAIALSVCALWLTLIGSPSAALGAQGAGAQQASEVLLAPRLTAAPGLSVTMAPVGLSLEYPVMAQALGAGPCAPPALVTELLRLGSPPLALGGVSQDMTAPPGALAGSVSSWETATAYQLPAGFWGQLRCLLSAAGDPLTVGLNMRLGNLAWAMQMAAEAQGAAPFGLSFSLGNEPDLYDLPNYASLDKPLPGAEVAAANLYLQRAAYLRAAVGSAPVVGPELARPAHWRAQLPRVIAQLHEQLVGVHLYPLSVCRDPREATIGGLLSSSAANGPARLAWVVAEARAAGIGAIISEANSVSCGGLAGVSDSPAAGVWAVRFVLSALKSGFREVRFHLSGNPYDPFVVHGAQVLVRPLGRALLALNTWLPVGSTVRTVPGVQELIASAIARPGGAFTLILDNQSGRARPLVLRSARSVLLSLLGPTRAGPASRTAHPAHGRIRLTLAANSLLAVSSIP